MRIGIEATSALEPHKAGVGYYSSNLIRAMLRVSDVSNIFTLYARHEIPSSKMAFDLKAPPSPPVDFKVLSCPAFWAQARLPLELWQHRQDVYFFPSAVLPLLYFPEKSVMTVHDVAFLFFPECFSPALRTWLKISTDWGVRRARKIIAVSEATRQDILAYYPVDPDNIITIHHGVREIFHPLDPEIVERVAEHYHITSPCIMCIGTLQRRKNIPRLLHAFYLLKQHYHIPHKLVLIGKKHVNLPENEIASTIQRLNLQQEVIETGYVPEQDMPALLNIADVFVLPSLYEGFGMPLTEAMACGVPVACSNTSSLPEVVGESGLLFDPYSVDSIAKTIYSLLKNPELRRTLRDKGGERAQRFSWDICAQKTLEVLHSVGAS